MGGSHLYLNVGAGPHYITSLKGIAVDRSGIATALHVGGEYQMEILSLEADLGFTTLATIDTETPFQRYEELLRVGLRLRPLDYLTLDALVGVGPAQNRDGAADTRALTFQAHGALGVEICLNGAACVAPFVGVDMACDLSGATQQKGWGLLFGVRIGGTQNEEGVTPVERTTTPPPALPQSEETVRPSTGFGRPEQYVEVLSQQRAVANDDLRRYVTLYFLAGFTTFHMQYLETLSVDPLVIAAWRTDPQLMLEGMAAFFSTAHIDPDPAHHPESEEKNALLILYDLLKVTAPHVDQQGDIPLRELSTTMARYRLPGKEYCRGAVTGVNLYLLFLARVVSPALPSDEGLRAMQSMGGMNHHLDRIRQLKRMRAGGVL